MAFEDKVVITCALSGVLANRKQCAGIPYTPVEIAEEAKRAYDAGASVVHLHARNDDGSPTYSPKTFAAIKDEIRNMVEFRELNLIEKWPAMPVFDIVMIRNVLIYFDVATKKNILRNVRQVMSPQGYLMLGSAETTMALDDAFERVQIDKGIAYRQTRATGAVRSYAAA